MAAKSFRVKNSLNMEPQGTAPSSPVKGDIYVDTSGNMFVHDGTTFNQLTIRNVTVSTVKTSNYTVLVTDELIQVDTTGGAVTITLPNSTSVPKGRFIVKDVGGAAQTNAITILRAGSDTIEDGSSTSTTIDWQYGSLEFVWSGTKWLII